MIGNIIGNIIGYGIGNPIKVIVFKGVKTTCPPTNPVDPPFGIYGIVCKEGGGIMGGECRVETEAHKGYTEAQKGY